MKERKKQRSRKRKTAKDTRLIVNYSVGKTGRKSQGTKIGNDEDKPGDG